MLPSLTLFLNTLPTSDGFPLHLASSSQKILQMSQYKVNESQFIERSPMFAIIVQYQKIKMYYPLHNKLFFYFSDCFFQASVFVLHCLMLLNHLFSLFISHHHHVTTVTWANSSTRTNRNCAVQLILIV